MDRSEIPLNEFTVRAQLVFDEFAKRAGLLPQDVEIVSASPVHVQFRFAGELTVLLSESDVDTVISRVNFDPLVAPNEHRLAAVESHFVGQGKKAEALTLKKYWRNHYCQVFDRTLKDFGFRISINAPSGIVENNIRLYATLQPMAMLAGIQLHEDDLVLVVVTE